MSWEVIARGNGQGIVSIDQSEIPHNTPMQVDIEMPSVLAWVFDGPGMEWLADRLWSDSGFVLEDVYTLNSNTIRMEGHANFAVTGAVILAVIAAIGIGFLITAITVAINPGILKDWKDIFKWVAIGGIGIGGIMLANKLVLKRK